VGGTANLAESYSYAANSNRLLSVANGSTTRQLSYIATGNLASNDNGAGTVLNFGYDRANRLVQVANQNAPVGSYQHNFIGERVAKSAGGAVTHFHYDRAGHLIAESDAAGNVLREHIWLGTMPVGFVAGGTLYFVHPDHLNTPQRITDAGQSVVWDIALAPFGGVAQLTPSLIDNLRFPGQYADAETGLNYNYFRDYDPSIGRYVESDTIGLRGGINTYAYVGENPLRHIDRDGTQEEERSEEESEPTTDVINRATYDSLRDQLRDVEPNNPLAGDIIAARGWAPSRNDVAEIEAELREARYRAADARYPKKACRIEYHRKRPVKAALRVIVG
jgi:RHS repeat-associated protein